MERTTVLGRLTWQIGAIAEIVSETPRVDSLRVALPDWPGHLPGQHVDIRLTAEDGYQAVRSYSISSAPEADMLEVTIERLDDGEVSPYLVDEVQVGDRLEFRGPIGGYFTWTAAQGGPLVLIAGGSGVVPLMSMIRHRAAVGSDVPARLLYSSRSPDDIIFHADLERLSGPQSGLAVIHTLTRSTPAGWTGYARRVDAAMLSEVVWPPEEGPHIYVCGSTGFVETVAATLVAMGHDAHRVRTERFGPTGG